MTETLAIFKSLQHPIRLEILRFLGDHPQDIIYSDLLPFVEDSTGKLNYHLRILDDLVRKTERGYTLTNKGQRILSWLQSLGQSPELLGEFERPDIITRLYPTRSLFHKYLLQITLVNLPVLLGSFYLAFVFSSWFLVIDLLLYGVILVFTWGYVSSIWYRITDTEVEVFKGIITWSHKIVPFRTITNIDRKEGPFDRIFGISTVDVHTAGNSANQMGAEEHLVGMVEGEEIKNTIVERIRLLNPLDSLQGSRNPSPRLTSGLKLLHQELSELNRDLRGKSQ